MGRTQKLAAIIKEGVRNPQKNKKGLKVLKIRDRKSLNSVYLPV